MITTKNPALAIALLGILMGGCSRSPEKQSAKFLARGKVLLEKKEYPSALIEFRNASRLQPNSAEPYYQAALVLLAMGDHRIWYAGLLRGHGTGAGTQGGTDKDR